MSKQGEEEYKPPEGDDFQSDSTDSGESPIGDFKSEPLVTETRKPVSKTTFGVEGLMAKKWFAPVFLIVGFFVVAGYLKYFKAPPANAKLDSSSAGDVIVPAGNPDSKSMSALSSLSSISKSGAAAPSATSTTISSLGTKIEPLNQSPLSTTPATAGSIAAPTLAGKANSLTTPTVSTNPSAASTTMPTLGANANTVTQSAVNTTPATTPITMPTLGTQAATMNNSISSSTPSSASTTMPTLGAKTSGVSSPSASTTPAAMVNNATTITTTTPSVMPTEDAKTDSLSKAVDSESKVVNSTIPTLDAVPLPVTKPVLVTNASPSATKGKSAVATTAAISLSKHANGKAVPQFDDSYQLPSSGSNSIFGGLAPASPANGKSGSPMTPPKNKKTLTTTTSAVAAITAPTGTIPGCEIVPGTTGNAGERTVNAAAMTAPVVGGSQTDSQINVLQAQIKDLHNNIRVITGSMEVVSKQMKNMTEQLSPQTTRATNKELHVKQAMRSDDQRVLLEASAPDMPAKERVSTLLFLKAAIPGRAWIRSAAGDTDTVTIGDFIHGYGKVTDINEIDGKVTLSTGIVIKYGPGDR